jgi:hypothetical protein
VGRWSTVGTKTVGIKYCGGCNPQIERGQVVKELQTLLPDGFRLADGPSVSRWDIGILISGCSAACADGPELRVLATVWILVSGAMVDYTAVPAEEIARVVADKLSEMAFREQEREE